MNVYQNQTPKDGLGAGAIRPAPEIQTCFSQIDSALELLMKNVSGLASRIHPICRGAVPTSATKPEDRPQRHTEIGERLNKVQETIAEQARAVADMADRIEL
jgi:hypothetical protein